MNNGDDGNKRSLLKDRTFWVSVLVSVVALTLAGLHVLSPDLEIDAITLGLLIIAMVPWLGPVIKSIELPGGIKLELRDEIRQLDRKLTSQLQEEGEKRAEVSERVRRVEQIVFQGVEIPPGVQERIVHAIEEFDVYLKSLGAEYGPFPRIDVRKNLPPNYQAHYEADARELVVNINSVEDLDVIRREFCYHAFHQPLAQDMLGEQIGRAMVEGAALGAGGIISGFGYYFPCSFKHSPAFGLESFVVLNESRLAYSYFESQGTVNQPGTMRIIALGERWAHAFWEIRQKLDAETFDRYLIEAWKAGPKTTDTTEFDHIFVAELTEQVSRSGEVGSDVSVQETFERWGFQDG
jgi:hypothetical protein